MQSKRGVVSQFSPDEIDNVAQQILQDMLLVQGGEFPMGSFDFENEQPVHWVKVAPFRIQRFPVTQVQWKAVMGANPSYFKMFASSASHPVEQVSWDECQRFMAVLSSRTSVSFRFPTEAEWELAARGRDGLNQEHLGMARRPQRGWSRENSEARTHSVGSFPANGFGIHDMIGNVWEWCEDGYGPYVDAYQENPIGRSQFHYRVLRGGSWSSTSSLCTATSRVCDTASGKAAVIGFRMAMDAEYGPRENEQPRS